MKTSLPTRNVLALDTVSSGVETSCKRIPYWRYPRLLISFLGGAIFVATVWNAASSSVAGDEKTVAALDWQYRTAVKQNGGARSSTVFRGCSLLTRTLPPTSLRRAGKFEVF